MKLDVLDTLYENQQFEKYIETYEKLNEVIKAIPLQYKQNYIASFIFLKKYDEAAEKIRQITNNFESTKYSLRFLYLLNRCWESDLALEIIERNGINYPVDRVNLLECLIRSGKIEEAIPVLEQINSEIEEDSKSYPYVSKVNKWVENYLEKGAFIETSYKSFKNNGNELQEGHIVFLKNVDELYGNEEDPLKINRPYMIYSIKGDTLYILPVSGTIKNKYYHHAILKGENYPNSIGDRLVKDNYCITNKNNVVSIKDKVTANDLERVMFDLNYKQCFFENNGVQCGKDHFRELYNSQINKGDVISIVDENKNVKKYFVSYVDDYIFEIYKIAYDGYLYLDSVQEITKDTNILQVFKTSNKTKENYFSQLGNLVRKR